ncbi:MAG: low molecular weight phosphotyrosine protein phosphatase [Clostridia bacterium]|nr:low molecular weight phosphotyrosine protein phosphatase [Clostridia bacterium]
MKRIMFVCHGNICRSPMAEFVMKDLVQKAGREKDFFIASSAVSAEEIWGEVGNPVYPPVKRLLAGLGISCEDKRATQLRYEDGDRYDLFLCMDDSNLVKAKRILGAKNAEKCQKALAIVGESRDVADPWYTRDFDASYRDILRVCEKLLKD